MQQTTEPITKDMLIGEVVMRHPQVADVFLSYGLHCVGCHVNQYESIEQGAMGHGMSPEEVDEMVAEANIYLKQSEEEPKEFTATMKAVEKLKELAKEENKEKWGLRVAIIEEEGGCCSNKRYELEFEEHPREGDIITDPGFRLFMDASTHEKLAGGTLDFIESMQGSGFKINAPKKGCGCGGHGSHDHGHHH